MYHIVLSVICQQVTFIMKYHERKKERKHHTQRLRQERKQNKTKENRIKHKHNKLQINKKKN